METQRLRVVVEGGELVVAAAGILRMLQVARMDRAVVAAAAAGVVDTRSGYSCSQEVRMALPAQLRVPERLARMELVLAHYELG